MAGYQGRFGKVSAVEFFRRDDWYQEMFIVNGGNYVHKVKYRHSNVRSHYYLYVVGQNGVMCRPKC